MTNNKHPLARAVLKGMAVGVLPLFLFSQNAVAVETNTAPTNGVSINAKQHHASARVDNNSIIRNIHHKLSAFKNNVLKPKNTKAEILAEKMTKAEFTVMALNDLTFVKQALEVTKGGAFTDDYAQCVFEHLDRANYLSELQEVAQYLVDNYPNDVDAYIEKLDFLIPVVRQIHNHPESVSFNSDSLADSSALMILTQADAEELERTINDERYRPLLATIGLPAKRADGKIEDISIMQVDSIMEYIYKAEAQCQ